MLKTALDKLKSDAGLPCSAGYALVYNDAMKTARVYAFGDSLVTGTYDLQGGWCDRLKRDLHRITAQSQDNTKYQMYNLGIGGESSRGLVTRIKSELEARNSASWPAIIMISTGKNDSRLYNNVPEVPIEEYERNLRQIIAKSDAVSKRMLLIGIGPCAEEEITFKNFIYTRTRLARYDAVMSRVAQELRIPKIDVFQKLLENGPAVFYRDKLHLSDKGYQIIYDLVKPKLFEMLGQTTGP